MIKDKRPTVADLRAWKGKRALTQILIRSLDEAAAVAQAGIEMASVDESHWSPAYRAVMPDTFVTVGLNYAHHATTDDYLRAAFAAIRVGADAVYCAASVETIRRMYAEAIPVVSHVGLIPTRRTWTGGYKAVGTTAASALEVWEDVQRLEKAGAFAVEMEVVPDRVAAEIGKRTRLILLSMGGGPHCDCQYLFAEDILGTHDEHYPRHSKRYRDFRAEYVRLQSERVSAFEEFRTDVISGKYPAREHCVSIRDSELASFVGALPEESKNPSPTQKIFSMELQSS
jgi:3-methyl-2-oxobutanoate hydroxymethyltransferase